LPKISKTHKSRTLQAFQARNAFAKTKKRLAFYALKSFKKYGVETAGFYASEYFFPHLFAHNQGSFLMFKEGFITFVLI